MHRLKARATIKSSISVAITEPDACERNSLHWTGAGTPQQLKCAVATAAAVGAGAAAKGEEVAAQVESVPESSSAAGAGAKSA
eukprot:2011965-Amphidinium_carterae.2